MSAPNPADVIHALQHCLPSVMRWGGAIARRMRQYNIAVDGKSSGNANTDALTLADLTVQELLIAALRDAGPWRKAAHTLSERGADPSHTPSADKFVTDEREG